MQKCRKKWFDSVFIRSNIIHQTTVNQFSLKISDLVLHSWSIYEKNAGLKGFVPKNLIYTCEHFGKSMTGLMLTTIHRDFPQTVHISGKEF
jgi:uncharacterized circularly permuted ATP-grasp superfamily protein